MPGRLIELFEDEKLVEKIKMRLPYLFQLAELESSRAGRIGMEVGSAREKNNSCPAYLQIWPRKC